MDMDYLQLPPLNTTHGMFGEEATEKALARGRTLSAKRKLLPSIRTSMSLTPSNRLQIPQIPQLSPRSAAAALADALGISPSDLEPPARATEEQRIARRTSSIYTTTPEHNADIMTPIDYMIEQRLKSAVADTLGLPLSSIPRDESFQDLGGDTRAARLLRARCQQVGLSVKTRDILDCRTLAELETRITPMHRSPFREPSCTISPLKLSSAANSPKATRASSQQRPLPDLAAFNKPMLQPKASKRYHNRVEQVLSLNSDVSRACVIKPKAGMFEGQTVAFLSLASCVIEGPNDCDLKLLNAYYTSPLPSIRAAVKAKVDELLVPSVWVVLERLPLDDNGVINRRKMQTWIQNANEELHRQIMSVETQELLVAPTTDIEAQLQRLVGTVLHMDTESISMNQSFAKLGGDSKTAMQLVVRSKSQGISLKVEDVLQTMSLTQLASLAVVSGEMPRRSLEATGKETELSPMQRLYFHTVMGNKSLLRSSRNGTYRFNQSLLLRINKSIGIEDVHAAVEAVVAHHAMLRTRFRRSGASWSQHTLSEVPSSYHFGHHAVCTNEEMQTVIKNAQINIDIENGPVFAAHHFHTNDGYQVLYLVAHHLVIDSKSWHIITQDLEELLLNGTLATNQIVSYQGWSSHQRRRISSMENPAKLPFAISPANCEYWGVQSSRNTYGSTVSYSFTLGSDVTSLLEESNHAFRTKSSDIFMAALLQSFSKTFTDRATPTIWSQEHDRDALDSELDITQTVGWFTSLSPLSLSVGQTEDMSRVLSRVKDSRLDVAERGVSYFASQLRHAASAEAFASSTCPMEVIFTYAGPAPVSERQDHLLEQLPIPTKSLVSDASDIGANVGRIALFEVSASVEYGELKFKFVCNQESSRQDLIQLWVRSCEAHLRQTIHRLHIQVPELTRADMPFIDIEYDGIAKMNRDVLPELNVEVSNIECIYPVTPNQQNLLVNEALVSGTSIMQAIYTLDTIGGYVDVGRICAAWQGIIEKHPALRTVFSDSVSNNGLYDQIILRRHSPNMLFIESFLADEAMESVEKISPPALVKGTPWHRLVVCQAPGKTLLKLEISQAICDSTSLIKIFNELDRAYFHHESSTNTTVSYPEYLQCLKTTPVSTEFWRELLTDVPSCQFPTLVSRSVSPKDYFTDSIDLDISPQNLADFAGRHEIEVTTVLRVAWGLVLRAYVGNDTVCFGYRTSGRDIPANGLSDAVGCFSNVLACRFHLHPSQAMDELLLISDENHHESLHHQHVSVNKMQRALGTKGGRLFNTCLSFGYENELNSKPGSRVYHIKTVQHSEYDLNVDVNFRNGGLTVDLGHRILNSEQAGHVAHAFGKAIESLMHAPSSMVKEMNLFNDHDQEQVLRWNGRSKSPEKIKNHIHRLIAEHALENSDIQAVCAWDGDLTYGELDELAMTVAGHLRNRGVTADSPVPVIVDKSRWAIVAMLGVLNSGGILVPVDAELPSMFGWVTKSVGAQIVLASESVRPHLEGVVSCDVVYLNEETVDSMAFQDVAVEPPNTKSHQTACILFEHQGAEQHKGIKYTHGALSTAFISQGPALRINPSSRVMQVSSFSTDVALSEVFTTLINGGCICVPSAAERLSNFTSAACRMQVNWSYLTPTLSRSLRPEALPDMAIVCFRTLNLDEDTYAPWADRVKVLLAYGSAVSCPLGLSASEIKDTNSLRCIGKPAVGNFWVVSPSKLNRLVPIGAVGVLVIESPTLAEGYETGEKDVMRWNPAAKQPGRLLRTGHFVRYKEDGQLELVAGQGDMTSIEGKTFLKSEVEPHLRKCLGRGVDVFVETIAFNYHDSDSKPILTAFIQMGGDELFGEGGEELNKLSQHTKEKLYLAKRTAEMSLRDTLPRHMIPSTFIPVRKIPLTSSLEVNRLGLSRLIAGFSKTQLLSLASVPNPREVQAAGLHPLPLTRVEERVRSLWASVLNIEDESSITAEDGFVRLGGNHDLAHELVIVARQQGISISVIDVLRNMSLTEICRGIALPAVALPPPPSSNANISIGSNSPRISNNSNSTAPTSPSHSSIGESIAPQLGCDRDAIEDITEASSLQTRFVEAGMLSGESNNNNKGAAIDWFAIHIQNNGSLDWGKLEHACNLVTLAHPILRTTFATHNRRLWQVVLRHPIHHAKTTTGQAQQHGHGPPSQHQLVEFDRYQCPSWRLSTVAGKLIKREQGVPIDFRKPATKFLYLDGGKNAILLLRLSRAQYNDLSLPVLLKDLGRLYEQGELTTKNAGFCDVMRAAKQASKNGAVDYWRALLRDSQMTQVVTHTGPSVSSIEPKIIRQQIPTGSLQNLGIPFETILKGAWAIVLSKLSGSDDVVFGHLVEGKHLHLENVLGPCGGIVPVRAKIPTAPVTPYDYFRNLHSQHVASIPYENMQFVDILQKCTPWPTWTRFSTVVQHQAQSIQNSEREFAMGNAACRLSSMVSPHVYGSDLFVKSVPMTSEGGAARNMDISLTFCEKRVHPFFAEEVLKMLCSTIGLLTSAFVMEPLVLKSLNDDTSTSNNNNNNNNNTNEGAAAGALRIPLSPIRSEASGATAFSAPVQAVLPDHASAIHAVISAAWESVLGAASLARVRDVRSVPFYDIWGSLIPAAELARFYNESMPKLGVPGLGEHTVFTLEDMMEAPTMMLQYEMIIAKQQQPRRDSHHHQHSRSHSRNLSGSHRRSPSVVVRANAWGKNLKKLTTSAVGGGAPAPVPQTIPEASKLAPTTPTHTRNRSHSSSMETMTTGSSQSDEDEMSPTQMSPTQRLARRRSVFCRDRDASRGGEGLGKKKSTQFLGKFGMI
ncbi:non-ribosomal peptide synthetase [Apiospora arundinis]|uniref:Non-ribosomal peptide synthetase n=1 Tax=Apiospora arundinis TaxID=335852 RepID=A0ABR2II41_9PEZI